MTVRQVPVRHTVTGATGLLPETALPHFDGWERTDAVTPDPPTETPTEQAADSGTEKKKAGGSRG